MLVVQKHQVLVLVVQTMLLIQVLITQVHYLWWVKVVDKVVVQLVSHKVIS